MSEKPSVCIEKDIQTDIPYPTMDSLHFCTKDCVKLDRLELTHIVIRIEYPIACPPRYPDLLPIFLKSLVSENPVASV